MNNKTLNDDIEGLYETHLPVANLERSIAFYREKIGLELAIEIPERGIAFFWVGGASSSMLGLWHAGAGPLRMISHFAFRMPESGVHAACDKLKQVGIKPLGFYGEPICEPVVIGWMPAISVYFKDPDGHSIEFIAHLDQRPNTDFGVALYSEWKSKHGAK